MRTTVETRVKTPSGKKHNQQQLLVTGTEAISEVRLSCFISLLSENNTFLSFKGRAALPQAPVVMGSMLAQLSSFHHVFACTYTGKTSWKKLLGKQKNKRLWERLGPCSAFYLGQQLQLDVSCSLSALLQ